MPKHKWAEVIHAFADGKMIQYRTRFCPESKWNEWKDWMYNHAPGFMGADNTTEYRVKSRWQTEQDAFAAGKEIESRYTGYKPTPWALDPCPKWTESDNVEYRVKPSRWQAEKDAFAAGKTIQYRTSLNSEWRDTDNPLWWENQTTEYRVKPIKWAKEQEAYRQGKTIQRRIYSNVDGEWDEWVDVLPPQWIDSPQWEYRVKPEPKPDIVRYGKLTHKGSGSYMQWFHIDTTWSYARFPDANVEVVVDGETLQVKDVRMLK